VWRGSRRRMAATRPPPPTLSQPTPAAVPTPAAPRPAVPAATAAPVAAAPAPQAAPQAATQAAAQNAARFAAAATAPAPTAAPPAGPTAPVLEMEVVEELRSIMGAEYQGLVKLFLEDAPLHTERLRAAAAGNIIAMSGIGDITIGDTICSTDLVEPLPFVKISAPTMEMTFSVNDSPFAGREGKYVTSRNLRNRLNFSLDRGIRLSNHFLNGRSGFRQLSSLSDFRLRKALHHRGWSIRGRRRFLGNLNDHFGDRFGRGLFRQFLYLGSNRSFGFDRCCR